MKPTLPLHIFKPGVLGLVLVGLLSSCGGNGGGSASSATAQPNSYGNLTITSPVSWSGQTVTVTGTLAIGNGGCLTLTNSTLLFSPAVEDTGSFVIQGNGCLNVINSTLKSGSGKQWNLVVKDNGAVSFAQSSVATNHSGLRFFNSSAFTTDQSNVEEVQVHDNASLTIRNASSAYVVAFFTGAGSANFGSGEFNAGNGITRNVAIPTGAATTGTIAISNSNISGFQLDLQDTFNLSIGGASSVVLALHLNNYVNNNFTSNITSSATTSGMADFSASTNPKFSWTSSQIQSVNLYLAGTSNLVWNGTTNMTEVNALDTASLTLNSGVSLWADLAQTYNNATLTLNSTTLLQSASVHPSFTAMDSSTININNVIAPSQTTVYRVGSGQVTISGGSGW